MKLLKLTVQSALKRPVIVVLPIVLMLVFSVINTYNPALPLIIGLSSATGNSVFEGVISAVQLVLSPNILPTVIIALIGCILFFSLMVGLLFSGYLYVLNNTITGVDKTKGDFTAGIKKYFMKISLITLRTLALSVILAIFFMIVCIPAVIITRAAAITRPELLGAAVFVDILTIGVLFFSLMFASSYMLYWYPAALKDHIKPFTAARHFVETHFWKIVIRFIVFDLLFVIFQYIIILIPFIALKLLLEWFFCSAFFTVFVVFIMNSFKEHSIYNDNQAT